MSLSLRSCTRLTRWRRLRPRRSSLQTTITSPCRAALKEGGEPRAVLTLSGRLVLVDRVVADAALAQSIPLQVEGIGAITKREVVLYQARKVKIFGRAADP